MITTVETKINFKRENVSKKNMNAAKKRKSPIELFGIFSDKIRYESDIVLMS